MPRKLINAYAQHKGGARSVRDSDKISIDLNLDLLNGCEYNCEGCFVSKKNEFDESDIDVLLDLVQRWDNGHYDINELFIGPTDIFSAVNFDRLVLNPKFQEICSHFTFTCSTTLMNDYEDIKRKYDLLLEHCLSDKKNREIEIFVVIDDKKYLAGDKEYLDKFNKNLELLDLYNVFFVLNVYSESMFDVISLDEMNKKIFRDYNSKLRINPSYLRGTSFNHLTKYMELHKILIEQQITNDNIGRVFMNMIDVYFGSFTFNTYSFRNHKLYVAPLLYEAIPQDTDFFNVPRNSDKYTIEGLDTKQHDMILQQYDFSKDTEECYNCEFITSCVGRNVLSYMEHRKIKKCLLPKKWFRDASKVIEYE